MRGQALVELLVSMLALVPLYFGIAWVAKLVDMQLATGAAARALAFECTVRVVACRDADAHPALAAEVRRRHFGTPGAAVRSSEGASGLVDAASGDALHADRRGAPLLERFEDVTVSVVPARFDTPLAFAGGPGDRAFPGAVRTLSELGGPGRFGLELEAGLVEARVDVQVARSRPGDGWVTRLLAMPVSMRARRTVLTDAWNASGPYGGDADSVDSRVTAGSRVPGLDTVLGVGWLPVRGLLLVAGTLGFESSASLLRWHEIDVDLVPADRVRGAPPGPPGPPPVSNEERP
jgi:hypothetical protein